MDKMITKEEQRIVMDKISVGLVTLGLMKTHTAVCLIQAVANTKGVAFNIVPPMGCYVHESRETVVQQAKLAKSTHILFVDWDMVFAPNAIETMLDRDKDIIGVDYHYKSLPLRSVWKLDEEKFKAKYGKLPEEGKDETRSIPIQTEPFECKGIGTGFCLIKMAVFDRLPQPWFYTQHSASPEGYKSDDLYFCEKARQYGFTVWLDPTIEVGHIGDYIY